MNDDNSGNIQQFRPPPKIKPRLELVQEQDSPLPENTSYRAYGVEAPRKRDFMLSIEYHNGAVELAARHYLINVLCASHQALTLIFTNSVINLYGRNLHTLLHLLREGRIGSLHCFNPERHEGQKPPEHEAIITRIERSGVHEFRTTSTGRKKS